MVNNGKLKTTIGDLLDRQVERFGENDALIHVDWNVRYTYKKDPYADNPDHSIRSAGRTRWNGLDCQRRGLSRRGPD